MFEGIRTPNRKTVAGMAALAIAAGMAGGAKAHPNQINRGAAIETVKEKDPFVKYKEDILENMATGKMPFRVLNLAVSFSIGKNEHYFRYTPKLKKYGDIYSWGGDPNAKRIYWVGEYPGYIKVNGEDYLIFVDYDAHKSVPWYSNSQGAARDTSNTLFMKASDMPKDTKIYSLKNGGLSPNIHSVPAHVDKSNYVIANGVPFGEPEIMLGFTDKRQADQIVKNLFSPSSIHSLENLK